MCKRVPVGAECASMRRVGTPRVYLTIQVSDAVVAHLLARAPPLFADADTGFILGRGTEHCDHILATRSTEVLDAFKGNTQKSTVH